MGMAYWIIEDYHRKYLVNKNENKEEVAEFTGSCVCNLKFKIYKSALSKYARCPRCQRRIGGQVEYPIANINYQDGYFNIR